MNEACRKSDEKGRFVSDLGSSIGVLDGDAKLEAWAWQAKYLWASDGSWWNSSSWCYWADSPEVAHRSECSWQYGAWYYSSYINE